MAATPLAGSGENLVPVVRISCLKLELPYYTSVSAGFPSPADDYEEVPLSLDSYIIRNPATTFFLRVEGQSMTGAGIYDGDILVVDRSLQAKSSDVIIAVLNGEFTVKRLIRDQGRFYLRPENPAYKPTEIGEHDEFQVWGVVIKVIHDPYEL